MGQLPKFNTENEDLCVTLTVCTPSLMSIEDNRLGIVAQWPKSLKFCSLYYWRTLGIIHIISCKFSWNLIILFTGLLQSFQTPKMCHLWLISLCEKNCIENQILIGIIPTFSENFIQINQVAINNKVDWKVKLFPI